ncbi:copper resistance protein CopC [Actinokineospora auranticolor]|uniref:CopC domain-containing protein n=1 Tax=Actinokineospora auranticolor TaxID=155976 RepID=A0A2S6GFT8_9PSEU|nr:copper resistance CopC family protein [Actinokineospora auranticolor]PPK64088.1 hypothetical protein CLV40_12279 [Actinokineospora auranticolor]
MSLRRVLAALLVAGATLVGTALPASAHTELESSNPAKGATVSALPATVELTFTEAVTIDPKADSVAVTGPEAVRWTVGKPVAAGRVVTVPVTPVGPAGAYKIEYRVTSDDGHAVGGAVEFTMSVAGAPPEPTSPPAAPEVTAPAAEQAATAPAPSSAPAAQAAETGMPKWVWFVLGLVAFAVVIALVFFGLRKSNNTD